MKNGLCLWGRQSWRQPPFQGGSTWVAATPMLCSVFSTECPWADGPHATHEIAFCGARLQACRVDSRVDVLLRLNRDPSSGPTRNQCVTPIFDRAVSAGVFTQGLHREPQ